MLPWPDYTHPLGPLNLASHLQPAFDNPPDLGPKSYVAYGRCCSGVTHCRISGHAVEIFCPTPGQCCMVSSTAGLCDALTGVRAACWAAWLA